MHLYASLLQSSVSHDPSEIILIYLEIQLIISSEMFVLNNVLKWIRQQLTSHEHFSYNTAIQSNPVMKD